MIEQSDLYNRLSERFQELMEEGNYAKDDLNVIESEVRLCVYEVFFKAKADALRPLTKEELMKMEGQPVWTYGVSYAGNGEWGMWDIIDTVNEYGVYFGYSTEGREWWDYDLRDYTGKLCGSAWVCYWEPPTVRRRPLCSPAKEEQRWLKDATNGAKEWANWSNEECHVPSEKEVYGGSNA